MNNKKFKLITLLGIRPDIIRMFKLIKLLDDGQKIHNYKHIFAHTGQHFDYELDQIFYRELGVRPPDWNMQIGKILKESGGLTNFAYQSALLFQKTFEMIEKFSPDAVLYLGDTNSVLSSIIVSRLSVPVIHIEAGGRSFDWRMPEEKNRIIIDHLSDALYCYMPRHRNILINEGIQSDRIKVVGNIIYDALDKFIIKSDKSNILSNLKLKKNNYILVTLHREENSSEKNILSEKIKDLIKLSKKYTIIFPLMPRVKQNLIKFSLYNNLIKSKIILTNPLGYFDFLKLQKNAQLIITDSGTVQEEAMILGVPALVTRRSTERPETIKVGATIQSENNLYKNAIKAMGLKINWDKKILNPTGKSPSLNIYNDLIKKIKNNYFKKSREYKNIKNKFINEAYGKF